MLSSRGSVGLSWIRVKGHALAVAFLTAASTTLHWIAVRSRTLALSLLSRLSANVSWIGVRGHAFALSLASITSPQSRIDERVTGIRSPNAFQPRGEGNELRSAGGIEPKVSARIRDDEPKARQSTALVCIEPWRNRLPIVKQVDLMSRL
jgi:hypothetical protein